MEPTRQSNHTIPHNEKDALTRKRTKTGESKHSQKGHSHNGRADEQQELENQDCGSDGVVCATLLCFFEEVVDVFGANVAGELL